MSKLEISAEVDLDRVKIAIEQAHKLEDDPEVFKGLADIAHTKKKLKDLLEAVEKAESEVKVVINERAKGLFGPDWRVIKGNGFKINRSFTGSVYNVVSDKVAPEFIKIKVDANADAIDDFVEANQTLPEGIEKNPNRGESIRIAVTDNENN